MATRPDDVTPDPSRWERYGLPGPGPGERMGMYGPVLTDAKPRFFQLRAQLLDDGRSLVPLAETDGLWSWIKVYASGGENTLHAHPNEDHLFIVLAGQARFFGPHGEQRDVGRNEGVMLPAGTAYRFHACGEESLVLLRVGARGGDGNLQARLGADGEPLPGGSRKNRFKPPVYRAGEYYE